MGSFNLFHFPWGQVFLSPWRFIGRRALAFVLMISITMGLGPVPSRTPMGRTGETAADAISETALSESSPFFPKILASLKKVMVLRGLMSWWRGDPSLKPVLKPYRKSLRYYFLLTLVDSFILLGVPFAGQNFFETAARGIGLSGSLGKMIYISAILFGFEGLDLLRIYVQYLNENLKLSYIADVQLFLMKRWLLGESAPLEPAQAQLIPFHAPSLAVRNIEIPRKLPLTLAHGILNGWLLWRMDPVVASVAILTAVGLSLWSERWKRPLAEASADLRQAESETVTALTTLVHAPPLEALREAEKHFQNVKRMRVRQVGQNFWFNGVVERVGTVVLMKGVMLWCGWYQYLTGHMSTAQILTILALAWNVQFKITGLFTLVQARLEAESAAFLLPKSPLTTAA